MPLNGACYIRVSTEEQTEYSPDAQLRIIKDYAIKNNIRISDEHIYLDAGISGRTADKRPAFMKMISAAKTKPKPFDIILVHKFDRFARSREDSVVYKSLLKKEAGIKVISITESIEDDKFSVILEAMLEAMAEYYSLNLGEEVKKGMTEKALRGELQTPAPFGYRIQNGHLIPEPVEAQLVKQIFKNYADGMSLRLIARELNISGHTTIKGNSFDKRAIEYIISNPLYAGKIRWTTDGRSTKKQSTGIIVTEGKHEPIIGDGLWELVKKQYQLNKAKKGINNFGSYDGRITTHWLRGLVKCAKCGCTLAYCRGYKSRSSIYRCNKYLTGGCDTSQSIKVDTLEEIIKDVIKQDTESVFGIYSRKREVDTDLIKKLERLLKKNEAKLERARQFAISGLDSVEEYAINKKTLTHERQLLLDTQNEYLLAFQERDVKSLNDILSGVKFSADEKNNILKELVKKIVYDKEKSKIEIYYFYFKS